MDIDIIGDGIFGGFLKRAFFENGANVIKGAPTVVIAVAAHDFNKACEENKNKFLINVCSVQSVTNSICLKHSSNVLGLHPMFGPRTPQKAQKTSLLTLHSKDTATEEKVIKLFSKFSKVIDVDPEGNQLNSEWHDQLMAKSHLATLDIAEKAAKKLKDIENIPKEFLPTSVIKLRDLVKQLQDMSEGTRTSIRANPFTKDPHFPHYITA